MEKTKTSSHSAKFLQDSVSQAVLEKPEKWIARWQTALSANSFPWFPNTAPLVQTKPPKDLAR